jgi:hypothetical protein
MHLPRQLRVYLALLGAGVLFELDVGSEMLVEVDYVEDDWLVEPGSEPHSLQFHLD